MFCLFMLLGFDYAFLLKLMHSHWPKAGNTLRLLVSLSKRGTAAEYFCALCICEVMASVIVQLV